MRLIKYILIIISMAFVSDISAEESIYSIKLKDIEGNQRSMQEYAGKVLLIVNTASNCGFTGQLEGMQNVYDKYKDRGLEVLAFPSNDFLGQEPGTNQEIKSFCTGKYHTTFQIFEKASVTGDDKQPLYQYLTEKSSESLRGSVKWNFEKFLVSKTGQVIDRYSSFTKPESEKIISRIEELLR